MLLSGPSHPSSPGLLLLVRYFPNNKMPIYSSNSPSGQVNETEMLRTFNCGVGGVVIVSPEDKDYVLDALKKEDAVEIGRIKTKGVANNHN